MLTLDGKMIYHWYYIACFNTYQLDTCVRTSWRKHYTQIKYIEKKLFGSDNKSQSGDKQSEVCYIEVKYVFSGWQNDIPLVLFSLLVY